jgi:hypothetical protein
MKQWHPIFARLQRPIVEPYFEVRTDVAVGGSPRRADVVLLRRTSRRALPFQGIWKHLTAWDIIEFKGRSVAPRPRDIDRLVELGLGIDRRLNQERRNRGLGPLQRGDVSFWFLANRLGPRFLAEARRILDVQPQEPGIWRCVHLGRLVYLVSAIDLPVEEESLPLHLVGEEAPNKEHDLARLVVRDARLWKLYGGWLAGLHPMRMRRSATWFKSCNASFALICGR